MGTDRPRDRPAVRREPLSRDRILDAAGRLVSDDGASAFSMRQLAERLGVTPMALYVWFPNRDELLADLAARTMGDIELPDEQPGPWTERTFALVAAVRAHLITHRSTMQLPGAAGGLWAAMFAAADRGLRLMLELGYDDRGAVDQFRALFWQVVSYALVVDVDGAAPTEDDPATLQHRYASMLEHVDDDATATVRRLLPAFSAIDPDDMFRRSTMLLIEAIEAAAPGFTTPTAHL